MSYGRFEPQFDDIDDKLKLPAAPPTVAENMTSSFPSFVQVWRTGWTCACSVCPWSTACLSSLPLWAPQIVWWASSGRTSGVGGSGQCAARFWVWSGDFCSALGVWPWSSPWRGACAFFFPSERRRWSEPARWLPSSSPPWPQFRASVWSIPSRYRHWINHDSLWSKHIKA